MRTLRVALVIALVAAGMVVGYLSGQGRVSAASDGLTAQDYADIQQLYWRYNHGADFTDGQLFASAFTDERCSAPVLVQMPSGGRRSPPSCRGVRKALTVEVVIGTMAGASHRRPKGHGAACTGWSSAGVGSGDPVGDLPGVVGWTHRSTGVYDDVYVKTSEGWRIENRTLNFDKAR